LKINPVIATIMEHRSIRKFTDEIPKDEVVRTIVRAGQQAPFASQYYSLLLSRNRNRNPWKAPLLFTVCVDSHKFELIMSERNWTIRTNDLTLLFFGIEDAALMAENMVIAARSVGLGSCFLGMAMYRADKIAAEYDLPPRVFPLVQLAMGYPAENPPTRPRYPIGFVLFEDKYHKFNRRTVNKAMQIMDKGYLAQDYYRKAKYKIPLQRKRKETYNYDNYSWTEHICRKWGQWFPEPNGLLEQLEKRGFRFVKEDQKRRQ
jgi:FMN reductase (NADPH)